MNKNLVSPLLLWFSVISIFVLMYPGAHGPFLMDDFIHFPKLAWLSEGSEGILRFIFSNDNGSGRPLSYVSLLIEDNAWPTGAFAYKMNNILFHCLNTFLLYWVVLELFRQVAGGGFKARAPWIALIVAVWWGIHPIQLSAVMLTIQRMTILSGTFVLLGVLVYLKARSLLSVKPTLSWMLFLLIAPLMAFIAILFKEPGLLLPCFLMVIEMSMSKSNRVVLPRNWFYLVLLGGLIPILLLLSYYFYVSGQMEQLYFKRDFSLYERMLTQPRVLLDYLKVILFPSLSELGPYKDYYSVSRGMFDPLSTVFSLLVMLGFIIGALYSRLALKRPFYILFLGVFWFLLGHIMESSFVPIELYFEHRNYVPMIGVCISVVAGVFALPVRRLGFLLGAIFIYLCMLSFITFESAKTWGSEPKLAIYWVAEHPQSMRAQYSAIKFYLSNGDLATAVKIVDDFIESDERQLTSFPLASLVFQGCYATKTVPEDKLLEVQELIRNGGFDHGSMAVISMMLELSKDGHCTFSFDDIKRVLEAFLQNPVYSGLATTNAIINLHLSELYKSAGNFNGMIYHMDQSYLARPQYNVLLSQAYYFADAGLFYESFCKLKSARENRDFHKFSWIYRDLHVDRYEKIVRDIASSRKVEIDTYGSCESKEL